MDVLPVEIGPQSLPLPEEQILDIGEQLHILPQQGTVLLQYQLRAAQADVLILPLRPGAHSEMALAGHEQGVVRQPPGVLRHKGRDLLPVTLPAPLFSLGQQLQPAVIHSAVVHMAGVTPPAVGLHLLFRQKAVLHQQVRIDEIGVAGKGGKALIGGIPIAGGAKGQHLPVVLARLRQKVRKVIRRFAQRADAIGGRQGENGHQNAAASIHR